MEKSFTSNINHNQDVFMTKAEQNLVLEIPVSRRRLGQLLKMDDRVLKSYESCGIITGIKSPGYKNTRFVPSLVLKQISEYFCTEHASAQHLFKTAKEKMKYGKKKKV